MGIVTSLLGYGPQGRTDDPNPVTGFTSREIWLIQTGWDAGKKDMISRGVQVLHAYIVKYPEDQEMFSFKGVPIKELPQNKKFQAHAALIMYTLTSIVDSLANPDLLVSVLEKIGKNHLKLAIPAQSFWNLKDVLLAGVRANPAATQEGIKAWDKILTLAFHIMAKNSDPEGEKELKYYPKQ